MIFKYETVTRAYLTRKIQEESKRAGKRVVEVILTPEEWSELMRSESHCVPGAPTRFELAIAQPACAYGASEYVDAPYWRVTIKPSWAP